jgi:hypothetical protein
MEPDRDAGPLALDQRHDRPGLGLGRRPRTRREDALPPAPAPGEVAVEVDAAGIAIARLRGDRGYLEPILQIALDGLRPGGQKSQAEP